MTSTVTGHVTRSSARRLAGAVLLWATLAATLSGCASLVPQTMGLRDNWPAAIPDRIELTDVPFFPQQEYQCGPAALETTLTHSGAKPDSAELVKQVYVPGLQGSLQIEMLAAARQYGRISYLLAPRLDDLLREVAAGHPVIVLQDLGVGPITTWHYAVVVGYDYTAGELYLRSGETRRLAVPFTVFEYTWKRSGYWAMVTMPPQQLATTASENTYLAAISAMSRVGASRDAIAAYDAFLQRWPGNVTAGIALANRHYGMGSLSMAEAVLRKTLVLNPDSVPVLNNLAQTVSDLGRQAEALEIIQRADRPDEISVENPYAASVRETHELIRQRLRNGTTPRG